jgi:hypothetical protein
MRQLARRFGTVDQQVLDGPLQLWKMLLGGWSNLRLVPLVLRPWRDFGLHAWFGCALAAFHCEAYASDLKFLEIAFSGWCLLRSG